MTRHTRVVTKQAWRIPSIGRLSARIGEVCRSSPLLRVKRAFGAEAEQQDVARLVNNEVDRLDDASLHGGVQQCPAPDEKSRGAVEPVVGRRPRRRTEDDHPQQDGDLLGRFRIGGGKQGQRLFDVVPAPRKIAVVGRLRPEVPSRIGVEQDQELIPPGLRDAAVVQRQDTGSGGSDSAIIISAKTRRTSS